MWITEKWNENVCDNLLILDRGTVKCSSKV